MSQTVKPPQVLFVRPKSAGPIRGRPRASRSPAPAVEIKENNPSAKLVPSISVTASAAVHPSRPLPTTNTSKVRRPSSAIGPRRCFTLAPVSTLTLPKTAREADKLETSLRRQDSIDAESFPDVANIYHVVIARKDAEDAAAQLVRRVAHFRAQEQRALHEMQTMRTHLETTLTKTPEQAHHQFNAVSAASIPLNGRLSTKLDPSSHPDTTQTRMATATQRKLKVPRSREQLEFLARQKRSLEVHKLEIARQQRERRKQALAEQKMKQAEQERRQRYRKDRIRAEEHQVIEQRLEKQRLMREAASRQQYERLIAEKQRQYEALSLVAEMEEEERNLRLRLEALHFHREYMQQELRGSLSTGSD